MTNGVDMAGRLVIKDPLTGIKFLIDSGSDLSLLPRNNKNCKNNADTFLYAANGTVISTFRTTKLNISLGLRRTFSWTFVIANIDHAIIGADFLSHFKLLNDFKRHILADITTHFEVLCKTKYSIVGSVHTVSDNCKYAHLLKQFPSITNFSNSFSTVKHSTVHIISTEGQPVSAKARRLPSDKLDIAKKEIQFLLENGICRPSSSPWASPLHVVQKKSGKGFGCSQYPRFLSHSAW